MGAETQLHPVAGDRREEKLGHAAILVQAAAIGAAGCAASANDAIAAEGAVDER